MQKYNFISTNLNDRFIKITEQKEVNKKQRLIVNFKLHGLNHSVSLPKSLSAYLNVYSVGYIAFDDCRVSVRDNGNIEFWPEHFDRLEWNQWNDANYPNKQGLAVYTDSEGNQ